VALAPNRNEHAAPLFSAERHRPLTRSPTQTDLKLAPRVFAVCAAVLLVFSVALASLLPADTTLGQAIHALSADLLFRGQGVVGRLLGHGFWSWVVAPLLARPVWLMPASLGIVCVGGAVSALTHVSPHTKQKRS
jgi:hypothetical protein